MHQTTKYMSLSYTWLIIVTVKSAKTKLMHQSSHDTMMKKHRVKIEFKVNIIIVWSCLCLMPGHNFGSLHIPMYIHSFTIFFRYIYLNKVKQKMKLKWMNETLNRIEINLIFFTRSTDEVTDICRSSISCWSVLVPYGQLIPFYSHSCTRDTHEGIRLLPSCVLVVINNITAYTHKR